MAKPQKKKGGKPNRPSWFQRQVDQNGPDFLLKKQPLDIQRDAFNIVRDIARGNVTPRDFKYLFNLTVLSNVRLAVYNKYIETYVYNSSMTLAFQIPNGIQILVNNYGVDENTFQRLYNESRDMISAYVLILNNIDAMIAVMQQGYMTDQDREYCYLQTYSTFQHQLSRFKYKL